MERVNRHKLLALFNHLCIFDMRFVTFETKWRCIASLRHISAHPGLDSLRVSNLRVQWAGHSTRTSLCWCFTYYHDGFMTVANELIRIAGNPSFHLKVLSQSSCAQSKSEVNLLLCFCGALCLLDLIVKCLIFRLNLIALLPARNPKLHQTYEINEIFIFKRTTKTRVWYFYTKVRYWSNVYFWAEI